MKPSIKRGLLLLLMTVLISGIGYSITGIEAYAYSDRTILAFTSDVHNNENNAGANRLQSWITNEQQAYDNEIDYMGFCGDMGRADSSSITEPQYWTYAQNVMTVADAAFPNKVCYTTGNHELEHGKIYSTTNYSEIKGRFTVDAVAPGAPSNCQIYCMGSRKYKPSYDNNVNEYTDAQVTALQTFLNDCDASKPVFIISHYPLHLYSTRYTTNADKIIDALNAAAEQGQTIVFLWGHNHTKSDSTYDEIHKPNDTIEYKSGKSKTIKFTYAAAGCMSDTEYSDGSRSVKGKGLIVEVIPNTAMYFTYYDASGNNVTEDGTQEVALPGSYYTVSFDKNDDLASGTMSVQNIPGSTPTKLKKNGFNKPCYNFNGWNTQPDGSGTSYADEASINNSEDTTLYAQWAEGAHKWSFTGFTWTGNATDGYTAASANYVCSTVSSHTAAMQAALTTKVTEPTCTANGKTTYTATITAAASKDGKAHSETKEVAGDAMIAHTLEHYAAVPATANAAGNKEYWECSVCHRHFKDAAGNEEYGNNEWIEPATGGGSSGGGTPSDGGGGGDSGGGTPAGGGGNSGGGSGGGGAGGGGGPVDEPPAESDPVVVSDPNSPVDVTVTIQDNTATVAPISKEDLAEVSNGDVISLDVSGTAGKAVTSLCISTDTMKNIAESPAKGVEVKLDTATASLDQKMMESLAQQAKGDEIKLQIDSGAKAEATLNKGQKETIAEMNGPVVVEANLTSGSEKISQFNGGIMTLSIQYVTNDSARGWFLPDSGSKEPVPCSYTDHVATLSLNHCSHYAVEGYVPVENQLTVKACTSKKKPVAVKAKKVKKTARQIPAKKYVSVRNPKGDVSYEKISGKAAFSVSTENGSIIVKKGTKKGTYKLKIKVTDAGDNTYKAGSKNVTCYVKVK